MDIKTVKDFQTIIMNDIRNNLTMLYDFYIVTKTLNLSQAAIINNVSQSSLSRSISNLETKLDVELIIRNC